MLKIFTPFFLCLFLTGCSDPVQKLPATGELKHTSLHYDQKIWRVMLNNTDSLGGSNYAIQLGDQPIIIGLSERPDNTMVMVKSVLLQQIVDGQSKQHHTYTAANSTSIINSLAVPDSWSCHKAVATAAANPENEIYTVNCVFIGSGYWTLLTIAAPNDVTRQEIDAINQVVNNIKFVD